jgi:hypothetical protein
LQHGFWWDSPVPGLFWATKNIINVV